VPLSKVIEVVSCAKASTSDYRQGVTMPSQLLWVHDPSRLAREA
jgi:hypothetical protein